MEILRAKTGESPDKAGKKADFKLHDFLIANFKGVVSLAVAIVLGGGYLFLLKPAYDSITEEVSASREKEAEYAGLEKKLDRMYEMRKSYESISQDDLAKIDSMLPDSQLKDELLSQLESMILKNGLLLTALQIEEVKEKKAMAWQNEEAPAGGEGQAAAKDDGLSKDVGRIKISMDLVGTDYENLKSILGVIENNSRLLDITKINFSPETDKTSLELSAYFMKSQK